MLTPNSTAKKFRKRTVAIATAALAVASAVIATHTPAHARGQHDSTSASATTTLTDQTDLNVTVYNSNIALVRDVRNLTLPTGNFRLKFEDIAATVNPATVHFRSLTDASKLNVLEQNYEYDLLDPAKLLHKYVGKEVTLVHTYIDKGSGTLKREEVKATLLSDNNGQVWKIGNDIVTGEYAPKLSLPRSSREPLRPPDIADVARKFRRTKTADRNFIPRQRALVEFRLRPHRQSRRQSRRSRRLGHAQQQQRHRVPQRAPPTRRRRPQSSCRELTKVDESNGIA